MKLFYQFDAWLLDKFQRFSDCVSRKTGIGNINYKFADCCLTFFTVSSISYCLLASSRTIVILFIVVFLINGFLCRFALKHYMEQESQIQIESERARDASKIIDLIFFRVFILLVSIVKIIMIWNRKTQFSLELIDSFSWVSYVIFAYFLCCSGLPRQKGKIRQWIKSLFIKQKLAPAVNK